MKKKLVLMTSALMAISLLTGCDSHTHLYNLVEEVSATCTENGMKAHYTCEECDKLFDEDKQETTLEALTIAALGHDYKFDGFVWADDYSSAQAKYVCSRDAGHVEMHDATVTSKVTKDATCEEDGVETYTATYDVYTAEYGKVLPKLNHTWGEPTYEWSEDAKYCTATAYCGNDSDHKLEETVECTFTEIEPATEEADGKGKYTATFENEEFATQEKEVVLESLPTLSKLTFTSNGDGTYSVKCKDSYITGRVKIPSTYGEGEEKGTVTSLPEQAFFSIEGITEVFIPSSIKTIGTDSFYSCEKMTDVHFAENSVLESLGDYVFQSCNSLVSVTFPKSVKTVGKQVFDRLENLESVVFEEGNELESLGDGCFTYSPKLKTIKFAETSKFKEIKHTFRNLDSLEELDLPNSLESIKTYSVDECHSLKTLWLPKGLKSMEIYSIFGCAIENLYFKGTVEEWNKIEKVNNWCYEIATNVVHCTDGDVAIK